MRDISITKRILAIGLAATVLGGGAFGISVNVLAATYETSDAHYAATGSDDIASGDTVTTVITTASIDTNEGTVVVNYGTINNNGELGNNGLPNGTGNVSTNNGIIEHNYHNVVSNSSAGRINDNYGSVTEENFGVITNNYNTVSANRNKIENNFGTVSANITSSVSYSAVVVNNYGGTVTNIVDPNHTENIATVTNQFYSVEVTGLDNASADYGTGFTEKVVDLQGNTKQFVQVTSNQTAIENASGTVTITANENYEISGDNVETANGVGFSYSVTRQENGSYVVVVSALTQNVTVSAETLGLVIRAIENNVNNEDNVGVPNVVVQVDNSIRVTADSTSDIRSNDNTASVSEFKNADQGVITLGDLIAMLSQLDLSSGTADLNFGTKTNMSGDVMDYLCKNAKTTINCRFTHNGSEWTLIIPKIDTDSEEYKACMASLALEPGGTAGFIKIQQLFAPVGVQIKNSLTEQNVLFESDTDAITHDAINQVLTVPEPDLSKLNEAVNSIKDSKSPGVENLVKVQLPSQKKSGSQFYAKNKL